MLDRDIVTLYSTIRDSTSEIMEFLSFDVKNRTLALRRAEIPTPGPNEVRIRVAYSGICGTDLHILEVRRHHYAFSISPLSQVWKRLCKFYVIHSFIIFYYVAFPSRVSTNFLLLRHITAELSFTWTKLYRYSYLFNLKSHRLQLRSLATIFINADLPNSVQYLNFFTEVDNFSVGTRSPGRISLRLSSTLCFSPSIVLYRTLCDYVGDR